MNTRIDIPVCRGKTEKAAPINRPRGTRKRIALKQSAASPMDRQKGFAVGVDVNDRVAPIAWRRNLAHCAFEFELC
jgi:hypothetical protein